MTYPLPAPTNGAALLDALRHTLTASVPNLRAQQADAVTLWTAATHALATWNHAPRLLVRSALPATGKTRLLHAVAATSCRPYRATANVSTLHTLLHHTSLTVFVDDADTALSGHNGETLRVLMHAGYHKDGSVTRVATAGGTVTTTRQPVFGMVALASLGQLPTTLTSRAVVITLRRTNPVRPLPTVPWRNRRLSAELHYWLTEAQPALDSAPVTTPLVDRAADVWEPLLRVADHAGHHWPHRARRAALALTTANDHAAT